MLKGVNKQILEVTNTESPYFEKIIFFVRSSSADMDEHKLRREAERISVSTATKPPRQRMSKFNVAWIIACSTLASLSGIALSFVINHFI